MAHGPHGARGRRGRPDPAVASLRSAVRGACADLPGGALVLVACSGGPDSLALAATAAWLAPRCGWRAGAVVVDHALQAGSAHAAERAGAACSRLGLDPVEVVRAPAAPDPAAPARAGGPEAAARAVRYAALEEAAQRLGAAAVLLGHTRDDQAEQVLLGLARGSGARSLAGMPARRGPHRRPLLGLPRAVVARAGDALGLQPWSDPANADPHPLRNRVRARVLPVLEAELGPGVAAALARTAEQLREDADVLDALAADLLARARVPGHERPDDVVVLDVAVLAAAAPALRRRALRAALLAAGSPASDLHRDHVLPLDALVTAWRGQGPLHLPGRVSASRACGRLALRRPGAQGRAPEHDTS
ncbi:tRNA lysidine(34) synthetase TilS [Quadrisphaera sp. DSM 44207]|uniref:tRNA lysidine(34) synthetase TilS n=1 Tax=Quadrisphaera sp. DSM 44207 TaxID=1881057 RepID=UPI0008882267|nr:tRNA lysidine(34) synthetase TilS [Quadrisphaera sp. DSM 44207]SDQ16986.1 tRNA(Ile)-lysidine synthase [Quadrisphaera sp. DSM 44207]